MLYKFKSRVTGDLIMLEPNGRQMVQLMGKEPGRSGIVTVEQIPAPLSVALLLRTTHLGPHAY